MGVDPNYLERIALERLPELQTASGLFRGGDEGGVTGGDRASVRASAVVLIGLSRAEEASLEHGFSLGSLRSGLLSSIGLAGISVGELGLALWAEAVSDGSASGEILSEILRRLPLDPARLPLEELAWLVSGLSEAEPDGDLRVEMQRGLADRASASGLFSDSHRRIGGGVGTIASQLHAMIAMGRAGTAEVASGVGEALIGMQQPDGAWPALVDSRKARVADVYPVFAVNQLALAPMAFRGLGDRADESVEKGIAWAQGGNVLGFDLVHPEEARIDHGIVPRRHVGSVIRGVDRATRLIKGEPRNLDPEDLILDPHVSAEDLGWILEAWAGRPA